MKIIAGQFKNRKIETPPGLSTRPTANRLRESVFNICQTYIEEAHFLDLYAGSGAVGLEALSRGAATATFIENNRTATKVIQHNIDHLKVAAQTTLLQGDVLQILPSLRQAFDIIYADPPYSDSPEALIQAIDTHSLLSSGGYLFVETTAPLIQEIHSLTLIKSRRVGRAYLHQFH